MPKAAEAPRAVANPCAAGGRGGRTIGTKRTLLVEILGLPVAAHAGSARPHDVDAIAQRLGECHRWLIADGVAPSMLIFKALHILSMFTAVTLLIGVPIFVALAIWQRDVRGLAAVYRLARRPGNTVVGSVFLLAGVVFGLLTAATGGFDFFAGWLIAAYVMVAALILANLLPAKHRVRQVAEEAVEAEAGRRPVDEVVRDMAGAPIGVFAIDVALFVAIIADMVLKPF